MGVKSREPSPAFLVGGAPKGLLQTGRRAWPVSRPSHAPPRVPPIHGVCHRHQAHEIARLLEAYRGGVNFYVGSLWQNPGALDKKTLARLAPERTRLQSMQKDQALRQALAMVSSTRRSAQARGTKPRRPRFTGMAVLCHGVSIAPGRGSFDLVVRLSTLRPRERIAIPTRKTRVLNKWLARPGARLVQGCAVSENRIIVWVEFSASP